jgi:hypothetical protein
MVEKNFHRKCPGFYCEEQIALLTISAFDRMVRTITQCLPADVEAGRRHRAEGYEA